MREGVRFEILLVQARRVFVHARPPVVNGETRGYRSEGVAGCKNQSGPIITVLFQQIPANSAVRDSFTDQRHSSTARLESRSKKHVRVLGHNQAHQELGRENDAGPEALLQGENAGGLW